MGNIWGIENDLNNSAGCKQYPNPRQGANDTLVLGKVQTIF